MSEEDDIVEKPVIDVLYKRSSFEVKLCPVHLSQENSEDDLDDKEAKPAKVVSLKKKDLTAEKPGERREKCQGNINFLTELKQKLNMPPEDNSTNTSEEKENPTKHPDTEKPQIKDSMEGSKGSIPLSANVLCSVVQTAGPSKMATLNRPKSPKPPTPTNKNEKEESFWEKIGTLGRKKRIKEIKEVEEVQAEGKYAIDSPAEAPTIVLTPEEYDLEENEQRFMIAPRAYDDPKFQELVQVLIEWINNELASQRIIVQDLTEDLYDGQVLQKLFEVLTNVKLDVPEVTQSEEGQKQKLDIVLSQFNKILGTHNTKKWHVETIHAKNIIPILHLLVAVCRHFRPPVRLPEHVSVKVDVVQKTNGQLNHFVVNEKITTEFSEVGMRCERDAFDTLFDRAPDKLQVVKKSLVTFVNKHLNKLNLEVTEIENQFHDGVYLIMLMGLLEGFFVPLYSFHSTPKDFEQKVHNVSFAFELMEEVGLAKPKARPEDVVNLDLKSTLRVLYNLFHKYKSLS